MSALVLSPFGWTVGPVQGTAAQQTQMLPHAALRPLQFAQDI